MIYYFGWRLESLHRLLLVKGDLLQGTVFASIGITLGFIIVGLLVLHIVFKKLTIQNGNFLFRASNVGYFLLIMFILASVAGYINIDTMYGALVAGIGAKIAYN